MKDKPKFLKINPENFKGLTFKVNVEVGEPISCSCDEKPEPTFTEQTLEEFRKRFPYLILRWTNRFGVFDFRFDVSKDIEQFLSEKLEEAEHRISNEIGSNVHAASVKTREEERTRIIGLVKKIEIPQIAHQNYCYSSHQILRCNCDQSDLFYLVKDVRNLLTSLKEESV